MFILVLYSVLLIVFLCIWRYFDRLRIRLCIN